MRTDTRIHHLLDMIIEGWRRRLRGGHREVAPVCAPIRRVRRGWSGSSQIGHPELRG